MGFVMTPATMVLIWRTASKMVLRLASKMVLMLDETKVVVNIQRVELPIHPDFEMVDKKVRRWG